jgi:UDP-N-acetylmuramoylalanine-D-glutamate ligase
MARISPTVLLGKTIRSLARLRGGGSALPGLVVEKIQPTFLHDSLDQLGHGVILVTGTNGKTTTTKMIAELFQAQGLRVLTNKTGSNFTRGIVAMIVEQMELDGTLPFDIAVLELDEAYAKKFVEKVRPHYVVALNVMRDQLDRFGEIDATARLLRPVMEAATDGLIVNRDDPLLVPIARELDTSRPRRPELRSTSSRVMLSSMLSTNRKSPIVLVTKLSALL